MTHRVLFLGAWLFLLVPLFFFPGHEARGLVFGVFIGYFPALLLAHWIGKFSWVGLVLMAGFSGGMVALCAWAMDRARIGNAMRVWLLVFLLIGSAMGATISVGYHEWKNSPHIKMAAENEANNGRDAYVSSYKDYLLSVKIPATIVCAMWGLYLLSFIGLLVSVYFLVAKRMRVELTEKELP